MTSHSPGPCRYLVCQSHSCHLVAGVYKYLYPTLCSAWFRLCSCLVCGELVNKLLHSSLCVSLGEKCQFISNFSNRCSDRCVLWIYNYSWLHLMTFTARKRPSPSAGAQQLWRWVWLIFSVAVLCLRRDLLCLRWLPKTNEKKNLFLYTIKVTGPRLDLTGVSRNCEDEKTAPRRSITVIIEAQETPTLCCCG